MATHLRFFMSEAQAELFPDWEQRELTMPVPTDPRYPQASGVQLTYESLRSCCDGAIIATFHEGLWVGPDGREYSDVVIYEET